MGLLLATTLPFARICERADFADLHTFASSPFSDRLSYESECQEQWCGVSSRSYASTSGSSLCLSQSFSQINTSASPAARKFLTVLREESSASSMFKITLE